MAFAAKAVQTKYSDCNRSHLLLRFDHDYGIIDDKGRCAFREYNQHPEASLDSNPDSASACERGVVRNFESLNLESRKAAILRISSFELCSGVQGLCLSLFCDFFKLDAG